ncbi:hypothetical protein U9M48_035138 [Paspalum notatum var. saurae]|uniref:Aminotransferase-like plant mobile domain-containing protein n=1 Tax=Paspalum notatum var. saurae TaxID=547442 RepID=A0AAQ3X7K7_PASNO
MGQAAGLDPLRLLFPSLPAPPPRAIVAPPGSSAPAARRILLPSCAAHRIRRHAPQSRCGATAVGAARPPPPPAPPPPPPPRNPLGWRTPSAFFLRRPTSETTAHHVSLLASAVDSLVDRWRPETHTFHFPCGEMTITLQDMAMILGLPVAGSPVIDRLEPTAWHGQVLALFGIAPLDRQAGDRHTPTSGVTTGWLREHFGACPPDATLLQVERHARAWLWYLLACFLLPDSLGDTVSSTMLHILARPWTAIATYSWASCTLAHMYRQLCDGCRRRKTSSIGGCLYLLQVWSWERLPIGRPVKRDREEWAFEDSRPTVLWFWRDVEVVTGRIEGRYQRYTNELDCVTHRQVLEVEWTPYAREEIEEAELSPLCRRDENLWRVVVPLIYFVEVEYHIPTRVMHQFGWRQIVPPHTVPTDQALHKIKKGSRYSETDWRITHIVHTGRWDAKEPVDVEIGEAHDDAYFVEYLRWLQAHSRVRLRPSSDHRPICEVDSDDSDEYDTRTRLGVQPERAPVQDYVGQQLAWLTNEASSVLARAGPRPPGALKSFVLTVSRHCRRLSKKIGCYSAATLPPQPRSIRGGPSGSGGRSSWSSRSREVTPPIFRQSSTSDDEDEDDEDEEEDEDDDGDRVPDVLSGSQLHDAPRFTQTQHDTEAGPSSQPPATRRRRRAGDPSDVDSGNRLNTPPARQRRPRGHETPGGS